MNIYNSIKMHYIGKICIPFTEWLRYHRFIDDKSYEKRLRLLLKELKTIKFTNPFEKYI